MKFANGMLTRKKILLTQRLIFYNKWKHFTTR